MAAVVFISPARGYLGYECRRHHSWGGAPSSLPEILPVSRLRCSSEAAPEAISTAEGTPPFSVEIPFETPKRTSSLISTINVQKAIRGIAITNVDHYGRLGIARGDSYDKVDAAYAKMCEDVVNQGLDEEESKRRIELLKESYDILSSEEERRLYDWSLARNEMPDRYVWPFEVDITQTPTQLPPPQEPEDVGPTRLVGYFFLAWFVLSVILSITLNR
uniref:Chaperone DnaJ-domain superfamily protein n=1 Tax=Habenaria pantlingiana TaxID=1498489 RepID=A0A0F7H1C4_9ASPA